MRESIGSTFLYNMIFVFIIVVMAILTATMNYYKAYKVNSRILDIIRNNSGYNLNSVEKIDEILGSLGYSNYGPQADCPRRGNKSTLINVTASDVGGNTSYLYCVYYYPNENSKKNKSDRNSDNKSLYYAYGVTTFISADFPIIGEFRVPVFTKGSRIYRFPGSCQVGKDCN